MNLVVLFRGGIVSKGCPCAAGLDLQLAESDTDISHFAPVLTPAVAHDPVLAVLVVVSPANNTDYMVNLLSWVVGHNAPSVFQKRLGVDATGNGPTGVNFSLHSFLALDSSVFGDGRIWERAQASALATHGTEGGACLGDVLCRACSVDMWANTLLGFAGAGQVRVRGFVRNPGAPLGLLVDPKVRSDNRATVA